MESGGVNGNVRSEYANGAAFDASEPFRHPAGVKRHFSACADKLPESQPKKRITLHHDGHYAPTAPNLTNPPGPDRAAMANGGANGTYTYLYNFPEDEFGNVDFELSLLSTDESMQATEPPELPVPSEEIWQFFSVTPPCPDTKEPPSSVLRDFDNVSISTTIPTTFDPTLQFSPPSSVSPTADDVIGCGKVEQVSWEFVNSPLHHTYAEDAKHYDKNQIESNVTSHSYRVPPATPPSTAIGPPAGLLLRPYKAWFHLREMLQAKQSMYKNQPEVVFEFFARVVYTQRENFAKKQLFQLRDLFKVSPPYISGVLLN